MIATTISKKLEDSPTKKEDGLKIINKGSTSSTSQSSPWLRLKDPRIVRVSRAFGGKDRHSKVCTIKGLRDRRVRLSVPTAIQLYDLQERLGLNQPSKVVDWLLNVAKHEIDQLPPLPISPINFTFNHLTNPQSNKQGSFNLINKNWELDHHDEDGGDFWTSNESLLKAARSKQVIISTDDDHQKQNWSKKTENNNEQEGQQLVHQMNNNNNNNNNTLVVPYGTTSSFFQLDHHHPNFGGGFASQNDMSLPPSALSLSSSSSGGGSHVFVPYPTQMNNFQMFSTQNLFPNSFAQNPYNSMNQSSADSTTVRGFHFNIGPPRLFDSSSEASTHQAAHDKDQDLE